MVEPFRNLISRAAVSQLSQALRTAHRSFDAAQFESIACNHLESLELKARAMQICAALEATLPSDFSQAAELIEAILAPAPEGDQSPMSIPSKQGIAGWVLWGVGEFVSRRGLNDPERALESLHAMTQRFTAEWAIRPFLIQHPTITYRALAQWTRDPSAHVRRLVSEGSRPRLPWGIQLKTLIADPRPNLALLQVLQDDQSEYVRRSVANHLNDIAKDHPKVVNDWLGQYLQDAPPNRQALLKHASRTLIKKGDQTTLALWGLGKAFRGRLSFSLQPQQVAIGDSIELSVELESCLSKSEDLVIDYIWHRRLANGNLAPKVFKGWRIVLEAGEKRVLKKKHSLRKVTTRTDYPGEHSIQVQVNGQVLATVPFELM